MNNRSATSKAREILLAACCNVMLKINMFSSYLNVYYGMNTNNYYELIILRTCNYINQVSHYQSYTYIFLFRPCHVTYTLQNHFVMVLYVLSA